MKRILPIALLFAVALCSCDNGNTTKTDKEKTAAKDTSSYSLVSLATTNTITEMLCQNWENKADIDDGVLSGAGDGDLQIPFRSYIFFDDGSVVINPRDIMKTGKWKLDEKIKRISIVLEDGSKKDVQVNAIGVKSLLLKMAGGKPEKYVADGKKNSVLSDDPFYPSNNRWRIKPTHVEDAAAIKKRIIDCVNFYSKFFKDNADHGARSISFYGLPSCFKWYAGGISITNKAKLNQKWIDCFYNKEQAVQGQQLLENIISKKFKWDKTQPKWVRQSADVLLQMADSLK